jgi:hypothetical protein
MSRERAHDLAQLCTALVQKGNDFQNVWSTLLKTHPLVVGLPLSTIQGGRAILEIRLITGERLVFDGESEKFSIAANIATTAIAIAISIQF